MGQKEEEQGGGCRLRGRWVAKGRKALELEQSENPSRGGGRKGQGFQMHNKYK